MTARLPVVMVIDDNTIDQMIYRRLLTRSGRFAEVLSFVYAEEALDYLRSSEGKTDLILLDINMPRMNGFEFLEVATEEFGEQFDSLVIVMLTTSLDPADRERAMSFKVVDGFMHKPLTIGDTEDLATRVACLT